MSKYQIDSLFNESLLSFQSRKEEKIISDFYADIEAALRVAIRFDPWHEYSLQFTQAPNIGCTIKKGKKSFLIWIKNKYWLWRFNK